MPKWYRGKYLYPEIPKLSKEEIYARRVERLVAAHERDASRIARLKLANQSQFNKQQRDRLSRETRKYLQDLYDAEKQRQKDRSTRSAQRIAKSFDNLIRRERLQRIKLSEEGFRKAKAAAADRRFYHPSPDDLPMTKYGTLADTVLAKRTYPKMWAKDLHRFLTPSLALPCIQRAARREVMIAKKFNVGHRTPKRRNPNSGVPC